MRNIIVTGGSRGLGLAIAREARGGRRSGHRPRAPLERRLSTRRSQDASARPDRFRRRRSCRYRRLARAGSRRCAKNSGRSTGLVNNAGLGTEGLLATMHNSQIEALIRLNTLSPIVLTKYVVRSMMADGQRADRQYVVDHRIDGLQRPRRLWRDESLDDRLHEIARARGRQARHHCQRHRAGVHRDGTDRIDDG